MRLIIGLSLALLASVAMAQSISIPPPAGAVPGGTNGQIQFNNNGVFAGATNTGTGSVVLQNSPTLISPTLGAATATTLGVGAITTTTGALLTSGGPVSFIGAAPTPTGTGTPSMATGSTDSAGEATSGATATSLIITFATSKTNAPFCTVTPQTQLLAFAYTVSTTAITITQTATSGEKIDYICTQH